ncbi:HD domain-containing protein [Humisphaera borealis]|uniref:HD domain-containing protein n=1 Tax=Humisphaera borealis TaxID=2807512 RepID=A0A7M2WRW6_9BACT|nr:HD domain-containing protein [Humisphaera borealis]QOV88129.1 HD domain-containing protein [Humisphaera borealis]
MREKIIRDPVHDVIAFRLDRPVDALLFRLLNAAEFQRLRRIRQLGMASLAYPGADHSRYSHSLGVMETVRKMLGQLSLVTRIDPADEIVTVAAALLHDLGHGPFSHVFERVTGVHHERLGQRVVLDPESDVHRILIQHDKMLPEMIVGLLRGKAPTKASNDGDVQYGRTLFTDLLSSQLDGDRLDYLLRDNLQTGSGYGDYDLNWLLHALTVDPESGRLAVTWKGVSAVEAYLQARYHMYRNVYFHKVVRAAEGMVKLALHRAKRLLIQGQLDWPVRESVAYKAMTGQRMTMPEFRDLDDVSIIQCFKVWADSKDAALASLCRGLLFRDVYKTIDLTHIDDPAERQAFVARAEDAVRSAGGDTRYDLFLDEIANTPYEVYEPTVANDDQNLAKGNVSDGKEILVITSQGKRLPFGQVSPMSLALGKQLMFRRLHVAPGFRDAL